MIKNLYTLLFIFLTNLSLHAQVFQWVNSGGGVMDDESYCIALDQSDDVHVTGSFSSTATFGSSVFTSSGVSDMFVAKYSSAGSSLWEEASSGSPNIAGGHVLNVDVSGNVYVIGEFEDTLVIHGTTLVSAGLSDVLIAKYNSAGNFLWAIRAGGKGKEGGNSIRTDLSGNVYITGYFSDTASFGSYTQVSAGGEDVFVVKINTFGNFLWFTRAGGAMDDEGKGISVNSNSEIFVAGSFNDIATFGGTTLTSTNPQPEMYVSKLGPGGLYQWSVKGGGTGIDLAYEVATDNSGNAYVAGSFQNSAIFSTIQVNTMGGDDIYLAKFNSAGVVQWVSSAGGPLNDKAYAVSYDQSGRIYITGSYDSLISWNGATHFSNGGKDIFVACYNTSGTLIDVMMAGGPGFDRGYGITNNNTGDVFITGTFEENATFGALNVTSAGLHDMFVAKISGLNGIQEKNNSIAFVYDQRHSVLSLNDSRDYASIRIMSITGSVISDDAITNSGVYNKNISDLESGVYIVQLLKRMVRQSLRRL